MAVPARHAPALLASIVTTAACASCGVVVDVEPKSPFDPIAAPSPRVRAATWTDTPELCETGRTELRFLHDGQAYSFPIPLLGGARLAAEVTGAPDLDTVLTLSGPLRPDGSVGPAPVASDDDGGSGEQSRLGPVAAPATGTYLLTVGSWRGRGRGRATLEVSIDDKAGCAACLPGDPVNALSGCVPGACPDARCAAGLSWEDAFAQSDIFDPAGCRQPATADVSCALKSAAFPPGWPVEADRRIEDAGAVARGFLPATTAALHCLARTQRTSLSTSPPVPAAPDAGPRPGPSQWSWQAAPPGVCPFAAPLHARGAGRRGARTTSTPPAARSRVGASAASSARSPPQRDANRSPSPTRHRCSPPSSSTGRKTRGSRSQGLNPSPKSAWRPVSS